MVILRVTGGIDFYNVLYPVNGNAKSPPLTSYKGKKLFSHLLQPVLSSGP